MIRLRCKLIGSGTQADPFRVPLPSYSWVRGDYVSGYAVVDVRAEDVPPALLAANPPATLGNLIAVDGVLRGADYVSAAATPTVVGPVVGAPVGNLALQAFYDTLDRRYQESAGTFRPDVR